jgi:hypothetical protein
MRIFITALSLISCISIIACSTSKKMAPVGVPPYQPASKELHDTIARLDSVFFDAYNTCKLDVFASLVSEDLEFYHDRGGRSTSKDGLVQSIKNNICNKVKRELLPGSIEVYPIPNYGAVQMGAHRFFNQQEAHLGWSRYAKFVTIWKKENNQWSVTRVISLH